MAEEKGVSKRNAKVCPCEACKKGRGVPHKIKQGYIDGYSTQPAYGWRPNMTLAEKLATKAGAPKPWLMGVELETQLPDRYARVQPDMPAIPREPYNLDYYSPEYQAWQREYNRVMDERANIELAWDRANPMVTGQEAVSMARPRALWHAKHDGSVTGPEFASKPATLAWWYSRRAQFDFMFTTLLHSGMRSYTGDKCGLHVNISMTAFTDAGHLARFASLVNLNKSWSKRMSQRTEQSLHWGRIGEGGFRNTNSITRWAVRTIANGYGDEDRYNALNTPGGGRLEFRLPRGTLRLEGFYKNLEWVHSMVEYTRAYGDTTAAAYMRWVMAGTNYPDLRAFLTAKFGVGIATVEFTPTPAPVSTGIMAAIASAAVLNEYVEPIGGLTLRRDSGFYGGPLDVAEYSGACPCGDGCPANDCGNCGTDGSMDDDDDDPGYEPCDCGDGCERGYCSSCSERVEAQEIERSEALRQAVEQLQHDAAAAMRAAVASPEPLRIPNPFFRVPEDFNGWVTHNISGGSAAESE